MERISQMAKKEIALRFANEYYFASKKRKSKILDIITVTCNWSRDNTRRQLHLAYDRYISPYKSVRKIKPKKYSSQARDVLVNAWAISGQACGQYLVLQIQNGLLERLISFNELHYGRKNKGTIVSLHDPVISEIKLMSSATIDRYLANARKLFKPKSKSTTKPASYTLRNEIPFGKSYSKHDSSPGRLSTDTVAH